MSKVVTKKKKKLVIKKKKKLVVKKKSNKGDKKEKKTQMSNNFIQLGPNTNINQELEYDYVSDDESVVESLDSQPNYELIKKLPQLFEITSIKDDDQLSLASDDESTNDPNLIVKNGSFDIDTDSLFKDSVNGKVIYFDYNKNIIYNGDFIIIGTTTEDGEIELDDRYSNDYKDLLDV